MNVCFAYQTAGSFISTWTEAENYVCGYRDIMEVEVVEDGVMIDKASNTNVIGRSIAGNLVAGGAGLIVGGVTAKRTSTMEVAAIELEVIVNDPKRPFHVVNFVRRPVKRGTDEYREALHETERWKGILAVFIRRAEDEMRAKEATTVVHPTRGGAVLSAAEELRALHDLKEKGILSAEEFEAQKAKILAR